MAANEDAAFLNDNVLNAAYDTRNEQTQALIQQFQRRISELQLELKQAQDMNEQLTMKHDTIIMQYENNKEIEAQRYQIRFEEINKELQELRESKSDLQHSGQQNEELLMRLKNKKQNEMSLINDLEQANKQILTLKNQLKNAKQNVSVMQKSDIRLKKDKSQLEKNLQSAMDKYDVLQKQKQLEIQNLTGNLSQLQRDNEVYRQHLEKTENEKQELSVKLDELNEKNNIQRASNSSLRITNDMKVTPFIRYESRTSFPDQLSDALNQTPFGHSRIQSTASTFSGYGVDPIKLKQDIKDILVQDIKVLLNEEVNNMSLPEKMDEEIMNKMVGEFKESMNEMFVSQKNDINKFENNMNKTMDKLVENINEVNVIKTELKQEREQKNKLREENDKLKIEKETYALQLHEEKIALINERAVNNVIREKSVTPSDIVDDQKQDVHSKDFMNNDIIQKQIEKYEIEKNRINNEMNENLDAKYLPLHQFKCKDIYNKIKWWFYNDLNFKNNLLKTMEIFRKRKLNGPKLNNLTTDDIKAMVQYELKRFITEETINIMFEYFQRWKIENIDDVTSNHAVEIAYEIYNYPLINLLQSIMKREINGKTFLEDFEKTQEIIKQNTGWNKEEIYQIEAVLFQHQTFTQKQLINNINSILNDKNRYNKSLPNTVKHRIKDTIFGFDVESLDSLHFKIKNGKEIEEFSDEIVNMVEELITANEENKRNNNDDEAYLDDDFVKIIYELIADCFINGVDDLDTDTQNVSSLRRCDWICFNCNNNNFSSLIGSQVNVKLSTCSLCGIQQKDGIILKLKNHDTFVMVNNHIEDENDNIEEKTDDTDCDIEQMIQKVIKTNHIDLMCLNENNNKQCLSMINLAKHLIKYKRWLYKISGGKNADINNTIHVDIAQFVDNDVFHNVFIQSIKSIKKMTKDDIEKVMTLFGDIKSFINTKRKEFVNIIKKNTNIKPAIAAKLYSKVLKTLQTTAQTKQFGKFVSDIDMISIDEDYHHILQSHINHGNIETVKNAFIFFGNLVHYEDTGKEIKECTSFKRRQLRINEMNSKQDGDEKEKEKEIETDKINNAEDKNIWELKQYLIQSQLDIIHSFLVHSDWKLFVQRHVNQQNKDDEIDADNEPDLNVLDPDSVQNKNKYVSNDYGFGVGHEHPHISPIYDSIRHEMLCNSLCSVNDSHFQNLLIKAIKSHKIALGNEYKDELFCKYYSKEYNLLRNEPIGIRHILSIIVYTDLTHFCTAFRATYRKINNEISEQQVTARHRQLYYYSRSLFEAVEFFGYYMQPKSKVYHGLNKVMYFDKFTAYFNQPISTTSCLNVAQQFADGTGIILTLKSGTEHFDDTRKIPKYLSVSWLSSYPNEDENLFYGAYIRFRIYNITESANMKGHAAALLMFNKFQKMINNEIVSWDKNNQNECDMIQALVILINREQNSDGIQIEEDREDKEDEKEDLNDKYITKYTKDLFHYFCTKTRQITINNFKAFPEDIYKCLFIEADDIEKGSIHNYTQQTISLIPMIKLFACSNEIIFTGLNINEFTKESKKYINIIWKYINSSSHGTETNLDSITFQSEQQKDRKVNETLRQLANKNKNKFDKLNWNINYRLQDTHNLTFNHYPYSNVTEIKHCNNEQMIRLVIDSCNKSDTLFENKRSFIAWFQQNKIDGPKFAKYVFAKDFVDAVVTYYNNDTKLIEPSMKLFTTLNRYDFIARAEEEKERQRKEDEMSEKFDALRKQLQEERKLNELHIDEQFKMDIDAEYKIKEMRFKSEMDTLRQSNDKLQQQILNLKENENKFDKLTSEMNSNKLKKRNDKLTEQIELLSNSKYELIKSTSSEIDSLRNKIKEYTAKQ